ncbi:MAG: aromatic-ring-hydroxylating dioxygenase subunit beta [Hydrogenophaga sp.]|uniref:aromatic-ring-hydroxylating dioxygenase subunit beta n=1 Tax=Hydrogenophaga sp. TaxID=1904254 RepID=UPI001D5421E4|nr:aromatic-ring-hydroxylating dioxygenase subunit beta [Hydrogenophaga sp.]MBX3611277.1 aromatic-ring-hydroxylating dioxygenase subunit beta [Hydrogenophaga sp.]
MNAITDSDLRSVLRHHAIDRFNAAYADVLDQRRFAEWPDLFVADGRYRVQARENAERGLPLCLLNFESQAMMRDRIVGATQTIYHAPYYTRHVIGPSRITHDGDGSAGDPVRAEANYSVFRTKPGSTSGVYQVGRYVDAFVVEAGVWKLLERRCVYDSEMVLNSLIYPV